MAEGALNLRNNLNREFNQKCEKLDSDHNKNYKDAQEDIKSKKEAYEAMKKNGGIQENANMITSIYMAKNETTDI